MGRVMSVIFLAVNGFDPVAYAGVTLFVSNGFDIQNIIPALAVTRLVIGLIILWKGKSYRQDYSEMQKAETKPQY